MEPLRPRVAVVWPPLDGGPRPRPLESVLGDVEFRVSHRLDAGVPLQSLAVVRPVPRVAGLRPRPLESVGGALRAGAAPRLGTVVLVGPPRPLRASWRCRLCSEARE